MLGGSTSLKLPASELTTQSRGPPWKLYIQASYHPARRSLILVVRRHGNLLMNRAKKRQLQAYLRFRGKPMSVFGLVRFNWQMLLNVAVIAAASVGLMIYIENPFMAWLFGSAYVACVLRDLGYFLKWSLSWPFTSELLDWSKVKRLASENGIAA